MKAGRFCEVMQPTANVQNLRKGVLLGHEVGCRACEAGSARGPNNANPRLLASLGTRHFAGERQDRGALTNPVTVLMPSEGKVPSASHNARHYRGEDRRANQAQTKQQDNMV